MADEPREVSPLLRLLQESIPPAQPVEMEPTPALTRETLRRAIEQVRDYRPVAHGVPGRPHIFSPNQDLPDEYNFCIECGITLDLLKRRKPIHSTFRGP